MTDLQKLERFASGELRNLSDKCLELSRQDEDTFKQFMEVVYDLDTLAPWIRDKMIEKLTGIDLCIES